MKLPVTDEIQDFVIKNNELELALIGCRADSPQNSYDCCEYDIAILGGNTKDNFDKKIIELGNNTLEFLNFPIQNGYNYIALSNMIKLDDSNTLISETPKVDRKKLFIAAGKRRIVDSLYIVSKNSSAKAELNASLNLKIAAYDFIEGILLMSGTRPMPIHELNQLRQVEVNKDFINEAIQTCIECLGIERATRTIINRSSRALREILKERYDVELLSSKIKFLLDNGLLADCYYYIGKLVCSHLEKKDNASQINYHKLNSIALDLTNDYEKVKKMSALVKRDCKLVLKN
ncbi:MAG TPA: hypothetical protein VJ599_01175 [Nitrososphaeraceae archaeon]|nr:hypothetical protein [Nitrososphaeraceae archaeon]